MYIHYVYMYTQQTQCYYGLQYVYIHVSHTAIKCTYMYVCVLELVYEHVHVCFEREPLLWTYGYTG